MVGIRRSSSLLFFCEIVFEKRCVWAPYSRCSALPLIVSMSNLAIVYQSVIHCHDQERVTPEAEYLELSWTVNRV